ncbi:MAG: hypothetical protein ACHREM_07025 [Polyangiales bacterium]
MSDDPFTQFFALLLQVVSRMFASSDLVSWLLAVVLSYGFGYARGRMHAGARGLFARGHDDRLIGRRNDLRVGGMDPEGQRTRRSRLRANEYGELE